MKLIEGNKYILRNRYGNILIEYSGTSIENERWIDGKVSTYIYAKRWQLEKSDEVNTSGCWNTAEIHSIEETKKDFDDGKVLIEELTVGSKFIYCGDEFQRISNGPNVGGNNPSLNKNYKVITFNDGIKVERVK